MSQFNNDDLNRLLEQVGALPDAILDRLLTHARLTSYKFETLVAYSETIEQDVKDDALVDIDIKDHIKDFDDWSDTSQIELISSLIRSIDSACDLVDLLNKSINRVDRSGFLHVIKLFKFSELGKIAKNKALRDFKNNSESINLDFKDWREHLTSDTDSNYTKAGKLFNDGDFND